MSSYMGQNRLSSTTMFFEAPSATKVLSLLKYASSQLREIELVAAVRVAWLVAASPRREVAARSRSESVAGNLERPFGLDVGAAHQARVVHALGSERIQVSPKVEVQVHHRAVVLGRRDQDRGAPAPEKVVRVLRVERDGLTDTAGLGVRYPDAANTTARVTVATRSLLIQSSRLRNIGTLAREPAWRAVWTSSASGFRFVSNAGQCDIIFT